MHTSSRNRALQTSLLGTLILTLSGLSLHALSLASEVVYKPEVKTAYRADADMVGYLNLRDMRTSPLGQQHLHDQPLRGKWLQLKESINIEPTDFQEVAFSLSNLDAVHSKEDMHRAIFSVAFSITKPLTLEQIEGELTKKKNPQIAVERVTIDEVPMLQWSRDSRTAAIASLVRDNQTLLAFGTPQAVADIINSKNPGELPSFAAAASAGLDRETQGFVSLQFTEGLKARLQQWVTRLETQQAAGAAIPTELIHNLSKLNVMTTGVTVTDVIQVTLAGNYGDEATAAQISQSLEGLLPWLQIMANARHEKPRHHAARKSKQPKEDAAGDQPVPHKPHPRVPFAVSLSQQHKGDSTYLNATLTKVAPPQSE